MAIASLRAAGLVLAAALVPLAAAAAAKPFAGPGAGWDHTVGVTASAQSPRAQETWKKSGELLTLLSDGGLAYDDIVGMVKKNIADNALKPAVDRDRTCDGRRAHEVELTFGTSVVHQIIVDDAPGVTKLTYTRPVGTATGAEAMGALTAYCGP